MANTVISTFKKTNYISTLRSKFEESLSCYSIMITYSIGSKLIIDRKNKYAKNDIVMIKDSTVLDIICV